MMDLHKLAFVESKVWAIVDEDSGEQLDAKFSSFYSICKSIRSSTTTLRFRLWAISERITLLQLRRKARERGKGFRVAHYRTRRIYWKLSNRPENECWMRVKDVSSSLRLSTADVSASEGYFIQHVAPYCLGIVSFVVETCYRWRQLRPRRENCTGEEVRECKKVSWISRSSQLT